MPDVPPIRNLPTRGDGGPGEGAQAWSSPAIETCPAAIAPGRRPRGGRGLYTERTVTGRMGREPEARFKLIMAEAYTAGGHRRLKRSARADGREATSGPSGPVSRRFELESHILLIHVQKR